MQSSNDNNAHTMNEPLNIEDILQNIDQLPVDSISHVIDELTQSLKHKKEHAIRDLFKEVTQKAKALGFDSPQSFIDAANELQQKPKSRRAANINYRDIENPQNTWKGRGQKPKWLQQRLNEGHALEDFLIHKG